MSGARRHDQLLKAVMEHSGLEVEQIAEAARHGADMGWSGFIYNDEAAAFFDEHQDLIWGLVCEDAESMGYENPLQMVASFNRIDMADTFTTLKVLLSWYALEEAGRALESPD